MGSISFCCGMCTQLRGRGIAPLLIKDPIRALRLRRAGRVPQTWVTLPLQSWHRGHRSTINYLLAEESGTEEGDNQLFTPGIAKLEVVDC